MADKYDAPKYPPPSHSPAPGYQSPPPAQDGMVYGNQGQYDMNRGGPPGGYYQQPYGPPQGYGYPPPQQPQVIYERDRGGGGCCAGLLAGLACCCCLDALF
ncbi:uncharacterized protein Z518_06865 [Rhinocladiella mackenziei CBS 650.93]|uniref:Cysteine-rich transmembrane domain-containing protein n=1 Tax=Rhinocladiella mackenziei CBS 650.93 TaxID=1442369 RepID=A0A0D2GYP3_9EURO|nr:uncharacterized protein Z518_06865 [Rhinocladiella mackenziei CBS 650.93]KIX03313.1 hypothetical protein Z518_06865 [Rhinocladiella mackenziei CBS 650.93]